MRARILVIGSANVDFTVAMSRLPRPGETVSDGDLLVGNGGKGANQAVAARRLGAEVRFIGCVGEDAQGRGIRAALEAEGIGVAGLASTSTAATGTAFIMVDAEGGNLIAVAPGANRALTPGHVQDRKDDFSWAQLVLCQFETPLLTVTTALEEARRRGAVTILNPAPVPAAAITLWPLVDYVTPNESEAERLSGVAVTNGTTAERAGAALRDRGARTAIVTLGAAGAVAVSRQGVDRVSAFAVRVVDTTAAGDAFNAGLAVALAEERPLGAALAFASAAAALACTRRGAQDSLPRRSEADALLAR